MVFKTDTGRATAGVRFAGMAAHAEKNNETKVLFCNPRMMHATSRFRVLPQFLSAGNQKNSGVGVS